MTLWQGILLGLVQGFAEFLPVSSSGHLRVLEVVTGVRAPGVFVEVTLHVATLAAVLVVATWMLLGKVERVSILLKVAMVVGLIALVAGKVA